MEAVENVPNIWTPMQLLSNPFRPKYILLWYDVKHLLVPTFLASSTLGREGTWGGWKRHSRSWRISVIPYSNLEKQQLNGTRLHRYTSIKRSEDGWKSNRNIHEQKRVEVEGWARDQRSGTLPRRATDWSLGKRSHPLPSVCVLQCTTNSSLRS